MSFWPEKNSKITVHVHHHFENGQGQDARLQEIKDLLVELKTQGVMIMATLAQFEEGFARVDVATSNIAADIKRLVGQLQSGLSDADETVALDKLLAHATALEGIAASVEDPVPPPAPTT